MSTPLRIPIQFVPANPSAAIQSAFGGSGGFADLQQLAGVVDRIAGGWDRIGQQARSFYYTMRDIEFAAKGLDRLFTAPFKSVMDATGDDRRFRVAVSGEAGGMARATAVDQELMRVARDLPLNIQQLREVGVSMARLVETSSQLSVGSASDVAKRIADYSGLVSRLSALNPYASDPTQTVNALQMMLEGGGTRGARRLGIDTNELARIAGVRPNDFTGQPALLMDTLKKYVDRVSPNGVAGSPNELASVATEKLQDALKVALSHIGDSGLYDHVRDSVRAGANHLFDYFNSNEFQGRAKSISDSMSKTFDSATEGVLRLAQGLTGAKDLEDLPDSIARSLEQLSGKISEWARSLPGIASDVGTGIRNLGKSLEAIVGTINSIHAVASRPGETTGSAMLDYADSLRLRIDPEERRRRQLAAIQQGLIGMGVSGTTLDEYKSTTGASLMGMNIGTLSDRSYQLGTGGIKDPSRAMAIQKLIAAAEKLDPDALQDPSSLYNADALRSLSRSIPNFDTMLGQHVKSGVYHLPEELRQRVGLANRQGFLEPDYVAQYRAAFDNAGGLSSWEPTADPYAKMMGTARARLGDITGGSGGVDAFSRVKAFRDQAIKYIDDLTAALKGEAERDPAHAKELGDMIVGLNKDRQGHLNEYTEQSDELARELVDGVGRFGVELSKAIAKSGAVYTSDVMSAWLDGSTSIQRQVAQVLGRHGYDSPSGLDAIPADQRAAFIDEASKAKLQSIALLAGSSHPAISSLLGGQGTEDKQLSYLQSTALPLARRNLNDATSRYNAAGPGTDPATVMQLQRTMDEARESVTSLNQQVEKLQLSANRALSGLVQFGNSAQQGLEKAAGDTLTALELHAGRVSDIWRNLAKSLLSDMNQLAAKNIIESAFGSPNGRAGAGNGVGGMAGGAIGLILKAIGFGGATGGTSELAPTSPVSGPGVITGESYSMAFADGGVAHRPMLGLVGEAGAEGMIPLHNGRVPIGYDSTGLHAVLPKGRTIPATFVGGSFGAYADGGVVGGAAARAGMGLGHTTNVHNIIVRSDEEAQAHAGRIHNLSPNDVVNIVSKNLMVGGAIAQAQRRQGGR